MPSRHLTFRVPIGSEETPIGTSLLRPVVIVPSVRALNDRSTGCSKLTPKRADEGIISDNQFAGVHEGVALDGFVTGAIVLIDIGDRAQIDRPDRCRCRQLGGRLGVPNGMPRRDFAELAGAIQEAIPETRPRKRRASALENEGQDSRTLGRS